MHRIPNSTCTLILGGLGLCLWTTLALAADPAAESLQQRLQRVSDRMRAAQERLAKQDPGRETRELQQQALQDLEALLESAKQRPPNEGESPKPGPGSPSPGSTPMPGQPSPSGTPMPTSATGESQPTGGEQGTGAGANTAAKNSTERNTSTGVAAAEKRRQDRIAKDVWGHLPPQMRQELLNIYQEKYLPKYDDLVRRYYEALAEGDGQR